MRILIFLFLLLLLIPYQKDFKIIDCRIVQADEYFRHVNCIINHQEEIAKIPVEEWPENWEDTKKVGMIVKIKLVNETIIPFKSCAARAKDREREYNSRGMGQMQKPTNLPIDKDCQ